MASYTLWPVTDRFSAEFRSWNMSRIRARDTMPERVVRSCLHRLGYRYTVNGPKNKELPGKPDIVLPRLSTVVFVHGCFWHQHEECREGRKPGANNSYWGPKLDRTVERDALNQKKLCDLGWRVVIVWECEIEAAQSVGQLPGLLQRKFDLLPGKEDADFEDPFLARVAESPPAYGVQSPARQAKRARNG